MDRPAALLLLIIDIPAGKKTLKRIISRPNRRRGPAASDHQKNDRDPLSETGKPGLPQKNRPPVRTAEGNRLKRHHC
jgi:hypothetical protein